MTFGHRQLETLAEILRAAAEKEIMPRFRRLESGGVREKSSALDLVTDADEKAEWMIRDAVAKAFPDALFVGEESVARDAGLLDGIAEAPLSIIVDPIDGTSNFAWGLPLFGVMAGIAAKGETVAGIILDPVEHDSLRAIRGEGAWRHDERGGTRRLRAASPAPLGELTGLTSWYHLPEPERSRLAANLAKIKAAFSYRCAAYEYRLIAEGSCHFSVFSKLMPWDHAAGVLLHEEAGGYCARLDGSPYSPAHHDGSMIAAPDRATWLAIRSALYG